MKHWKITGVAFLLLSLSIVALSGDVAPAAENKLVVSVASWPGCGFGYLAKHLGYYKGLDVEFIVLNDVSQKRAAYRAGRVDLMNTTADVLPIMQAAGISGTVIFTTDISLGGDGIVTIKTIKTIKDLRGKRVAYAPASPSHFFFLDILRSAGLTFKDIKAVEVDDPSKAAMLLRARRVDAAVTWEPDLSSISREPGFHILVDSSQVKPLIIGVYLSQVSVIDTKRAALRRFVSGWMKAVDHYLNNKENDLLLLSRYLKIPANDLAGMLKSMKLTDRKESVKLLTGCPSSVKRVFEKAKELFSQVGVIKGNGFDGQINFTDLFLCPSHAGDQR